VEVTFPTSCLADLALLIARDKRLHQGLTLRMAVLICNWNVGPLVASGLLKGTMGLDDSTGLIILDRRLEQFVSQLARH